MEDHAEREGGVSMKQDEAIEKCIKAILRSRGDSEDHWRQSRTEKDFAEKLVSCLKELGVLPFDM